MPLKNYSILCALAVVVLAAPAGAQSTTGMGAMQYYVGNWSCIGGPSVSPPVKATSTYVADVGVLRQWTSVPKQGKMRAAYAFSAAVTYDAGRRRYVQTSLDNNAGWGVSVAKSWSGNTELWRDLATDDGKLGRGKVVRTSRNAFTFTGFATPTTTKPNFTVTCKRSS